MSPAHSRALAGAACVVVALFALGGATPETELVAALAVVAFAYYSPPIRLSGAAGLLMCIPPLVGLLQSVPLPMRVLRALSPGSADAWANNASVLGGSVGLRPISLDPASTIHAVCLTCLALLYGTSLAAVFRRHPAARVAYVRYLVVAIGCFAVASFAHPAFGAADKVYGLYTPVGHDAVRRKLILSPLINENHAAVVGCVGVTLALSLLPKARVRWPWLAAAGLSGILVLLTTSRGGAALLALMLVAMVVVLLRRLNVGQIAIGGVALVGLLSVGFLWAPRRLLAEYLSQDTTKLRLFAQSIGVIGDYRWTGTGLGAFGAPFERHVGGLAAIGLTFQRPENWLIQWFAEVGIPVASVTLVLAAYVVRSRVRRRWSTLDLGAGVGLVGLVLHDLGDFALQLIGPLLLGAGLCALLASTAADHRPRRSGMPPGLWLTPALPVLAFAAHRLTPVEELDRLEAKRRWGGVTTAGVLEASSRHPADFQFLTLAAALDLRAPTSFEHLVAAVRLAPARAQPHLWLARWFVVHGRAPQALGELRLAVKLQPNLVGVVLLDAVSAKASALDLVTLAPPEPLDQFLGTLPPQSALVLQTDQLLLEVRPLVIGAHDREIRRAPPDVALRLARTLTLERPDAAVGWVHLARLSDAAEGIRVLEGAIGRLGALPELLSGLIDVHLRAETDLPRVLPILDRLREELVARNRPLGTYHLVAGEVYARHRDYKTAVDHLQLAVDLSEVKAPALLALAQVAEKASQWRVMHDAYHRLVELQPSDEVARQGLARAKARLLGSTTPSTGAPELVPLPLHPTPSP